MVDRHKESLKSVPGKRLIDVRCSGTISKREMEPARNGEPFAGCNASWHRRLIERWADDKKNEYHVDRERSTSTTWLVATSRGSIQRPCDHDSSPLLADVPNECLHQSGRRCATGSLPTLLQNISFTCCGSQMNSAAPGIGDPALLEWLHANSIRQGCRRAG